MFSTRIPTIAHVHRAVAVIVGVAGLSLSTGRSAAAQDAPPQATLRFDVAGAPAFTSPYGPADVGRLRATFLSLPGNPTANQNVDVFCVDILHNVTFAPTGWDVYLTNLGGDASTAFTRQGARYATGTPDALTRYRKAAWLVDQFATVRTVADTAGIQGAMWLQFEPSLSPFTYANAAEEQAVTTWQTAADLFAGSEAFSTYDWSRFTVLTDVDAVGRGDDYRGLQELIMTNPPMTTTPEPTTVVLLGASLAVVGGVARRRATKTA